MKVNILSEKARKRMKKKEETMLNNNKKSLEFINLLVNRI